MDTDPAFAFRMDMVLRSVGNVPPLVMLAVDETVVANRRILGDSEIFSFNGFLDPGRHRLCLSFYDKAPDDQNQAVQIKELRMNGVLDPKFIWQGIYRPIYPEPWATQQKQAGNDLAREISNTDYLGWNGTWTLEFTSPIFTWIHQVQDLGWIYD